MKVDPRLSRREIVHSDRAERSTRPQHVGQLITDAIMLSSGTCLMLALSGCTFEYTVYAETTGGQVRFYSKQDGGWFGPDPCVDDFEIVTGDRVIWAISRRTTSSTCENDFPIHYGSAPQGFDEVTPPSPLSPGETYEVRGYGRVVYSGTFGLPARGAGR